MKVLASSREPLGVAGEAVFGVPSLPFPDPAHLPPVEKLSEYTAVQPVRRPRPAGAARIPGRPSTMPRRWRASASGWTASRWPSRWPPPGVNVLSADQLAERLDDAFRVLTGGSRTALPRQQTLRATIDWSYELLSEAERVLLQRLSVFAGGCTLEAGEGVCADPSEDRCRWRRTILDLLAALVAKSMVIADRRPGEATRYHLLETVRQYAREKLNAAGEGERLRSHHLRYFVTLAEEAEPELRAPIRWRG